MVEWPLEAFVADLPVPITHKTVVRKPRDEVFDALATAKGYDRWFTTGMRLEEKPDGEMLFVWRDWGAELVNTESPAIVVAHERPEKFAFRWWLDRPTTVTITFEDHEEGTLVSVQESGYENSLTGWERCLDCATGWGEALTLVKFYLEHGVTYR
jgi:uncharacterized protein YndB with AHSA1/START domain